MENDRTRVLRDMLEFCDKKRLEYPFKMSSDLRGKYFRGAGPNISSSKYKEAYCRELGQRNPGWKLIKHGIWPWVSKNSHPLALCFGLDLLQDSRDDKKLEGWLDKGIEHLREILSGDGMFEERTDDLDAPPGETLKEQMLLFADIVKNFEPSFWKTFYDHIRERAESESEESSKESTELTETANAKHESVGDEMENLDEGDLSVAEVEREIERCRTLKAQYEALTGHMPIGSGDSLQKLQDASDRITKFNEGLSSVKTRLSDFTTGLREEYSQVTGFITREVERVQQDLEKEEDLEKISDMVQKLKRVENIVAEIRALVDPGREEPFAADPKVLPGEEEEVSGAERIPKGKVTPLPVAESSEEARTEPDPIPSVEQTLEDPKEKHSEESDEVPTSLVAEAPTDAAMEAKPEELSEPEKELIEPEEPEERVFSELEEPESGASDRRQEEPALEDLLQCHTSEEIATLLQQEDKEVLWQDFLWALISEGDLPAATWLVRSLETSGRECPVPDWLLAVVQGSYWLEANARVFVEDMLQISRDRQPNANEVQKMLGLAAALRPALVAPSSGLMGWLTVPASCPEFSEVVQAVRTFANLGKSLRPEDLLGAEGAEERETALKEAAEDIWRWLEDAKSRNAKLRRASDVWRHLVGHQGALRELLLPGAENRRSEVQQVREELEHWQNRDFIVARIHEIDRELIGIKARKIMGNALDQLIRYVMDGCKVLELWCEHAEYESDLLTRGNWLFEQVSNLRSTVEENMPAVKEALEGLSNDSQQVHIAAAARCLHRAADQLLLTLNLSAANGEQKSRLDGEWSWLVQGAENLDEALGRRLLLLPEIAIENDGQPEEKGIPDIAGALRDASTQQRTLGDAFKGWLEKKDYRFEEIVLKAVRDEAVSDQLRRMLEETLSGSRAALATDVENTKNAIEQAVIDGIIDEERSSYSAQIEDIEPERVLNFPPETVKLEQIRTELAEARKDRMAELRKIWEGFQKELKSQASLEKWGQVEAFVEEAFKRHDSRVVEECFSSLREAMETGRELEEDRFTSQLERDVLAEFMETSDEIERWIGDIGLGSVAAKIHDGRTGAGLSFGEIKVPRREEAHQALDSWRKMKGGASRVRENTSHIRRILAYLGFSLDAKLSEAVQIRKRGKDYAYARVTMSAGDLAKPIPQFGSQSQGSYNVICVWERHGVETLSAWLTDLKLDAHSVIVLYLGRLKKRHRIDFTRKVRDRDLSLAILDETLMVFLAREPDTRLRSFLQCALPFAALNPYTPFRAGDVPREMFFGRDAMVRELQQTAGGCIVYGGRQLGKSALLNQVSREFHHPDMEQYGWVEDIKLVGDVQGDLPTHLIWGKLREGLKRLNLLSARVRTDNPDELSRRIREVMDAKPERRVLVLFDEADNFLNADQQDSFRVVEMLRALMQNTQRRFKVVFAGLHDVQRFQGIPNQPLAHFGAPLLVGPLEAHAAQQLVIHPLGVLGYRFKDHASVLRILSYTNYHPGLIQLFCQELLKRLHSRSGKDVPPYTIEQVDVEAVYRKPEVRTHIRERLDWTLALDERYQAIAWTLIYDQIEERDSYAHAYAPGKILELVCDTWPRVFSQISNDELRGLLDEMVGLGILVRNKDGWYSLRSPNLVRLMGTMEDIMNRIDELSRKTSSEVKFVADSHHALLDEKAKSYSPLTNSQERSLNRKQSGIGLVFTSEALGSGSLASVFQRLIPSALSEKDQEGFQVVPSKVLVDGNFGPWLDKFAASRRGEEQLVAYGILPENEGKLETSVRLALDVCRKHERRGHNWLRILFQFGPQAGWRWMSELENERRIGLENEAIAVVVARRWDHLGVRQRLAHQEKLDTTEICDRILRVTGGWPLLIDELFERLAKQDDPRPAAESMEQELADRQSLLAQRFRASLGLLENDVARRVFAFILREGKVPAELLVPELIGGDPALSPAGCAAAAEYLQRLGCIEAEGDELSVEAVAGQSYGHG